ncbi:transposase [Castellaniella sp.]|uniref:transposase n=1 Tax=Castellaniella sp. TaxID=1955812 RepID=UPI002AFF27DB|nr:transposase [Castellaniella sp.]
MHQDPTSKPRRRRRTYTAQFKTDLVAQCMDPAVSLAAVAIEHDLNPNVLRRWVIEHERLGLHDADAQTDEARSITAPAPANWLPFVPVQTVATERLPTGPLQPEGRIPLTLSGQGLTLTLDWPMAEHQTLAQWARLVLA